MLRSGWDELDTLGHKGDWAFFDKGKKIAVRWGGAPEQVVVLNIHKEGEDASAQESWLWDGSYDYPTLEPSIRVADGEGELWHGYLREGRLV
jgi:hypothetical protein